MVGKFLENIIAQMTIIIGDYLINDKMFLIFMRFSKISLFF